MTPDCKHYFLRPRGKSTIVSDILHGMVSFHFHHRLIPRRLLGLSSGYLGPEYTSASCCTRHPSPAQRQGSDTVVRSIVSSSESQPRFIPLPSGDE